MKAVLKNGLICPQGPLPSDWHEGTELEVEKSTSCERDQRNQELNDWMAKVQTCADEMDPADEMILEKSIHEVRRQARELARRQAGRG